MIEPKSDINNYDPNVMFDRKEFAEDLRALLNKINPKSFASIYRKFHLI